MFNKNHTPKRTVKNAVLKVPFTMPADLTNDIHNEIMDIIETTKFDKVSVPVSSYRRFYDNRIDASDNRTSVIGYIKSFNKEDNTFTVVIYSNNAKITSDFANPEITIAFTIYKDEFGAITKFIIAPTTSEKDIDDSENATDEISED